LHQGALSAWTSEKQKLGRDGSNPVAFFCSALRLNLQRRDLAVLEPEDEVERDRAAGKISGNSVHFCISRQISRSIQIDIPFNRCAQLSSLGAGCFFLIVKLSTVEYLGLDAPSTVFPKTSNASSVATILFSSRSAMATGSTAWWYFSVVSRRQAAMSVRPALVRPSSLTVASDAKHSTSPSASWAFSDDMKSSIAFGKCTDMVILLLSARIRHLRTEWSSACKWQERTTNFAGQTDLPARANQIRALGCDKSARRANTSDFQK
jgi:hypothetical protein